MKSRISILAIGAVVAVLVVAGCGSDSDAAVTKQAFVKQANVICEQQKAILEPSLSGTANEAINNKKAIEDQITTLTREASEIEAIGMPAGDEQKIEAMLGNINKALDIVEAKLSDIPAASKFLDRAEKQADEYGLEQCFLT